MFDSDSSRGRRSGAHREVPSAPGGRPDISDYLLAMRHELKAPLNAVIGMSGLLLDGELGDRHRQYAKSIHAAGESLATILNDLLDLSRIAADRLAIEPIAFDLKSMVEEAAKAMAIKADERGLALRVDWRPELPRTVIGDPGRTRQVLGNLVGHAMNSTSQGEVVIEVAPDGETVEGTARIRFAVEDTGIGLPQERLARVFNEYVPVDASPYRSFGVSGLGLRVSAELVQLMGGELGAESEIGNGSRFWFRLPMPTVEAEPRPVAALETRGGRALVIESDQASRHRFAGQLEAAGWSADFADDLTAVETLLRAAANDGNPFQACVLSDYAVRPSHAELAMHLKADEQLAGVALVMVTAVGSPGEGKRLWHAGFAAYLRKPVPQDEVQDTLLALESLNADGRGKSLITRHSLAEAKNAQSAAQFDLIDEVLASLTAPQTPQVLLIGVGGTDRSTVSGIVEAHDLQADARAGLEEALERMTTQLYSLILVDADQPTLSGAVAIRRITHLLVDADPKPPVVALTIDPTRRSALLEAGVDQVLTKPIRHQDLDRLLGEPTGQEPTGELAPEGSAPEAPVEEMSVEEMSVEETSVEGMSVEEMFVEEASDAPLAVSEPAGEPSSDEEPVEASSEESAMALGALAPPVEAETEEELEERTEALAPSPDLPAGPDAPDLELQAPMELGETASAEIELPEGIVTAEFDEPDSKPLAGFVANEWESEAETQAVIEPIELAEHGLAGIDPEIDDAGTVEAIDVVGPGEIVSLTEDQPEVAEPEAREESDGDDELPDPEIEVLSLTGTDSEQVDAPADDMNKDTSWPKPLASDSDHPAAEPKESGGGSWLELEPTAETPTEGPAAPEAPDEGSSPRPGPVALLGSPTTGPAIGTRLPVVLPEASENRRIEVRGAAQAVTETPRPIRTDLPVIGANILDQLGAGGAGFAQHLVATFLREAPQRIAELELSVSAGDAKQVTDAAHNLRAMGALLGAARLGEITEELAAAAAAGDLAQAGDLATDVEHAFLEIRMAVEGVGPPEAAGPAELPAISEAFLRQLNPEREEGTRGLAHKLVANFLSEAPTRLGDLIDAIEREDADAIRRLAPTLKGMSSLIGADALAKLCALVEADARLRRVGSARRYRDQLQLEMARVREALELGTT